MSLPGSEAARLGEAWPAYNRGLKSRDCCAAPVEYDYLFSENGLVAYKDGKVHILAALSVHLAPKSAHAVCKSRLKLRQMCLA